MTPGVERSAIGGKEERSGGGETGGRGEYLRGVLPSSNKRGTTPRGNSGGVLFKKEGGNFTLF